MRITSADVGALVRETRKVLGVTQETLAMAAGTGKRFIVDLEAGKSTCEIGKVLLVLNTLGITVTLNSPQAVSQRPQVGRNDPEDKMSLTQP